MERWQIKKIINLAFEEDLPFEDTTTELLIPDYLKGEAYFLAKEDLVVCGIPVVEEVFNFVDPNLKIEWKVKEGEEVKTLTKLGYIKGKIKSILKGERIALNFFQHLSGIATYTRRMVNKLKGSTIILLDTRKTLPGLKILQKYAVRIGGGKNHRFSLSDGILIKDNHIKALGGIENTISALKYIPHHLKVEIEVNSLEELKIILNSTDKIDTILLDNFNLDEIKEAIKLIKKSNFKINIEISGGINLNNISKFKDLEIDYISCGTLTHSIKAADISLKLK
ncbi:carboxylating nicotinate-nucleotide diphosphorylase [Candidatus Pacearchaeota archaeon]|nr:MAG: carboxylating nicotinate-nucleotide diphosphorylase [Candidatus Pacearchaeota archaeon]